MNYSHLFNQQSATDEVAEMIARAGNRSERRKILKALNKTENIVRKTNEKLVRESNDELERRANDSFGYIMSMVGIVLHDKYGWTDDAVGEMFTEISSRLNGKWSEGKTPEDVAKELYEKTGIELVVK